ncbi:MAG: putative aspartate aminotransferase [Pseudomonadota bacterium]|jgi:aspartate aminotransferase-like enzyme
MKPYLLLAPGPVNLHPKVREILSEPMIHHRTPLFDLTFKKVLERLPSIFGTTQRVYMLTTTGSGGMECLMVNTCNPGDEVLIINSGKFGERWVEMGKAFQLKVHELKVPWGEAVTPEQIVPYLEKYPLRAVFCQACETSTAVKHPLKSLGEIIKNYPDILFLVDGITAVGAFPVPMDEWHIDGLVAGSQKAFMLPTGMSFLSFSEKAWKTIPHVTTPRYYMDIREEDKANRRGESWFSSNVSLVKALDVVLEIILQKGLSQHFAEIRKRAEFTRHFITQMGFKLLAQAPADSITAFYLPEGSDSQKVRTTLEKEFNITIMGGQDQLKGKILRIGHMGYIEPSDQIRLMLDLQAALDQNHIQFKPVSESEMQAWLKS